MANKKFIQQVIEVEGVEITVQTKDFENDYFSLTDIAKYANPESPADIIKNWMRNKNTIEFLGIWEELNNPNFKLVEFDQFKNEAGSNSFVLTPKKWITSTDAIGLVSKAGRYNSGTYAHKDIAFEFASWISPQFKLYIIKEFQRLKLDESVQQKIDWNLKRTLAKVNYKLQTDAVQNYLITEKLTKQEIGFTYATEADVLNKAMFGMTAKEWRVKNSKNKGNIRDEASINQLLVLSNLESFNSEFIAQGLSAQERIIKLNEIAVRQMESFENSKNITSIKNNIQKK